MAGTGGASVSDTGKQAPPVVKTVPTDSPPPPLDKQTRQGGPPSKAGPGTTNRAGRGVGVGQKAYKAGRALAKASYGPTIAEDKHEVMVNNRRGAAAEKLTAGYFQQLGRFMQQGARQQRGIAHGLNAQLRGIGATADQQMGLIGQGAVNGLTAYTPEGAPGLSEERPALQVLAHQLAQQRGLAAQNAGGFRRSGALQGANYRSLAASNLQTGALTGQEELGNIAAASRLANEPINSQIVGLRGKEAALAEADAIKIHQQNVANQLTKEGLGLKNKALNVTAANDRARNALAAQAQQIAAAWHAQEVKLGWANLTERQKADRATAAWHSAEAKAKAAAKSGSSPHLTTNETLTFQGELDTTLAALKAGANPNSLVLGSVRVGGHKDSAGKVVGGSLLPKIPQVIVDAAQELRKYGYVTPKTAGELTRLGLHLNYQGSPIKTVGNLNTFRF